MTTQITTEWTWMPQQCMVFGWFAKRVPSTCLVVQARAGCTKTTSIVEAVNHAPPEDKRILACAFNKTIERELTARIADKRVTVKTLHGAGYGVMIRAWGYPESDGARGTRIAREVCGATAIDDAVTMVAALASIAKGTMPFLGADRKCYGSDLADLTSIAEEFGHVPDEAMSRAGWDCGAIVKAALECMRAACRKDAGLATREDGTKGKTCVDFDDMTYLPVRLGLARPTYDLTVVDEAQDMSPTQILLAQALTYSELCIRKIRRGW
jgi:superfamily I DNA/RNA helicase